MHPIRILHVYRTYYPDPPGGLQEAIRQIALATALFNTESRIFTLSNDPTPAEIKQPEAWVIRCKSWAAPASCDLGGFSAFRKFSESANWADVIHYHFPWPFADLLHLIVHPRTPAIITYHSDIVRQRWLGLAYAPLMRRMLRSVSAVVATSPAYARTSPVLSDAYLRDRVQVIPLGIEDSTRHQDGDNEVLHRLHLDDGEPFFLFIGVLRYYKGLHTLVEASGAVRARVVIAGSGPEDNNLRMQVRQLGLSNVVFAGQVSESEKTVLLKHCRALVLPSHLRSEAYGMVLVEAAMFGKPMITCEIGTGTTFVNAAEQTGLVIPPDSPVYLASAMNRLSTDKNLAMEYGNAARLRYEELFSGRAQGQAYSDLYREVAKSQ